jgi:hypothetical protein
MLTEIDGAATVGGKLGVEFRLVQDRSMTAAFARAPDPDG